jgi:hypothetical protein
VNYDPNDDERHYQPRGRLDPKPPREPKFTSISGVGKRLIESLRPHVSDDLKQRLSISLAGYLLPWVLLPPPPASAGGVFHFVLTLQTPRVSHSPGTSSLATAFPRFFRGGRHSHCSAKPVTPKP